MSYTRVPIIISKLFSKIAQVKGPDVSFDLPDGTATTFKVEIADTPAKRSTGLMFRDVLPVDWGMLFVFDEPKDHHFWMVNTQIPLDLIFIDENFKVVGISADAQPHNAQLLSVGVPSSYLLEVNAGLAAKKGIVPGVKVHIRK